MKFDLQVAIAKIRPINALNFNAQVTLTCSGVIYALAVQKNTFQKGHFWAKKM